MYRRIVPQGWKLAGLFFVLLILNDRRITAIYAGYGKRRERQENRWDDPCDSTGGKTMSYATMQDALFALDLADSDLWDRPRLHPDEPTDEPELPE